MMLLSHILGLEPQIARFVCRVFLHHLDCQLLAWVLVFVDPVRDTLVDAFILSVDLVLQK